MIEGSPEDASHSDPISADPTFIALFSRLVDDAERFVRAEIRLYRANLVSRLADARLAVMMLIVGFLLAQSATVALLVGLVVFLSPSLGALGSIGLVVGGALAVAGLLAWFAIGKILTATKVEEKP